MSLAELIKSVQFVVDSAGNRTAVQLDLAIWEEIVTLLEDLEDTEEMAHSRHEKDELVPWEQVVADYKASHPDPL